MKWLILVLVGILISCSDQYSIRKEAALEKFIEACANSREKDLYVSSVLYRDMLDDKPIIFHYRAKGGREYFISRTLFTRYELSRIREFGTTQEIANKADYLLHISTNESGDLKDAINMMFTQPELLGSFD